MCWNTVCMRVYGRVSLSGGEGSLYRLSDWLRAVIYRYCARGKWYFQLPEDSVSNPQVGGVWCPRAWCGCVMFLLINATGIVRRRSSPDSRVTPREDVLARLSACCVAALLPSRMESGGIAHLGGVELGLSVCRSSEGSWACLGPGRANATQRNATHSRSLFSLLGLVWSGLVRGCRLLLVGRGTQSTTLTRHI